MSLQQITLNFKVHTLRTLFPPQKVNFSSRVSNPGYPSPGSPGGPVPVMGTGTGDQQSHGDGYGGFSPKTPGHYEGFILRNKVGS